MSANGLLQCLVYVGVLTALAPGLGRYMARVYSGQDHWAERLLGPLERLLYRAAGVRTDDEMSWQRYTAALLGFNLLGLLVLFALQRLQGALPLNPAGIGAPTSVLSLNTAISFVTNTNWQAYSGEREMSYLTQLVGLTVQNFLSAATGMAVLVALLRGFARRSAATLGSFWVDLTRSTLYILLPLSLVLAAVLASQGVVQTVTPYARTHWVEDANGAPPSHVVALGPVASQVAIKQLGTNGGGFFNANSAHPFENPTPLSSFLQALAILLLPGALCFTFGAMVGDRRQGWAIFAAMLLLFLPLLIAEVALEQRGTPLLAAAGTTSMAGTTSATATGSASGNMEGKEVRFGTTQSALWAVATTAASNGSVNAMHDSFTPLGGLIPMWLMQLGEVSFGGVGSGLYGMLVYAIIAVFIAGLMVGRTPEYLGKKIEAHEMKMASLVILLPAAAALIGTAVACVVPAGSASLGNPGVHGFSEILYAFSSTANNNGSAFGGLTASGPFYALATGLCMLVGRFGVIVPVMSIAGSLAAKRAVPAGAGTLPTHTALFVGLLSATVVLVGALTFVPALALGPVVEQLQAAAPVSAVAPASEVAP